MALGRIGQRRQVVIPKSVLEALRLKEGDFVEITAQRNHVVMKPKKLVDADDVLTPAEEKKVRRGEAQLHCTVVRRAPGAQSRMTWNELSVWPGRNSSA